MKNLVRVGAIIMLVLAVTGLAFGIVLIVSGSTIHNETVEEVQKDLPPDEPVTIDALREQREQIATYRRSIFGPAYTYNVSDLNYYAAFNMLIQEKGIGVSLTNLSRAMMYQYAGIGILVLGLGLAVGGVVQYRMAGRMT
jgi:hypothetical protein